MHPIFGCTADDQNGRDATSGRATGRRGGEADQLVGVEAGLEYNRLFSRIVNLAPPPIGVGPSAAEITPGGVRV